MISSLVSFFFNGGGVAEADPSLRPESLGVALPGEAWKLCLRGDGSFGKKPGGLFKELEEVLVKGGLVDFFAWSALGSTTSAGLAVNIEDTRDSSLISSISKSSFWTCLFD